MDFAVAKWKRYPSWVKVVAAGSCSGSCAAILFQPLDLIKTRIQMMSYQSFHCREGLAMVDGLLTRNTLSSLMVSILQKERIFGLWKGLTPSLCRTIPGVGMYFGTIHFLKSSSQKSEFKLYENLALGFTSRTLVGTTLLPMTVIKSRFESGRFKYASVPDAVSNIWKGEGARGLFSGLAATIIRDAPYSGLYLMFYSHGKKVLSQGQKESTPLIHYVSGITAGLLASAITQPADVLKTRMQLEPYRYSSTIQCAQAVLKNDGVRGFYSGMVPRCMRRTLISAMSWTLFEEISRRLCVNE